MEIIYPKKIKNGVTAYAKIQGENGEYYVTREESIANDFILTQFRCSCPSYVFNSTCKHIKEFKSQLNKERA